jgi:chemotaxis protein MotB
MKFPILASCLLVAATLTQSCVSNKKYAELEATNTKLQQSNQELNSKLQASESELSGSKIRIKSLDEQIASERANVASLQAALTKCLNSGNQGNLNISKLVDEINASNKYIQQLVNSKNKSDSLNVVLTNNLTRSLSREEMSEVDVKVLKGVVYISLADNMLYKSGSYEISEKAGATLSKIAKIIKDYNGYDVLIEGNTDNVPISMQNIRNNWDLSTLRARL